MSYTKGKWRVDGNRVLGTSGEVIALAIHNNDDTIANAILMASAPDLLEFVKQFEQQIRTTPGFDYESFAPWLNARDLIKQAEGGE